MTWRELPAERKPFKICFQFSPWINQGKSRIATDFDQWGKIYFFNLAAYRRQWRVWVYCGLDAECDIFEPDDCKIEIACVNGIYRDPWGNITNDYRKIKRKHVLRKFFYAIDRTPYLYWKIYTAHTDRTIELLPFKKNGMSGFKRHNMKVFGIRKRDS